jgi:hypothetical protein
MAGVTGQYLRAGYGFGSITGGFSPTSIWVMPPPAPDGSTGSTVRPPLSRRITTKASANLRSASDPGRTLIPNNVEVLFQVASRWPVLSSTRIGGSNADFSSATNRADSGSFGYEAMARELPENCLTAAWISFCCSIVNSRPARAARSFKFSPVNLAVSLSTSATNLRVVSRMSVSILPASMWIRSSPATPVATSPAPRNPRPKTIRLGLLGEWIVPRLNSRQSCMYSAISTANSTATPTTTRIVQKFNHQSSDNQDFSRLSSALARADASMKRFQRAELRAATIQLIAIAALFLVALGVVVFLHFRYR